MADKLLGSQYALFFATSERVTICRKILILSKKVDVGFYLNRLYRGTKAM